MLYPDPGDLQAWLAAGDARGADAATLKNAHRDLAAVYMLGYLIEVKLKALASVGKKKVPRIHDLQVLWEACGFKVYDLSGRKRLFMERWCVSLRYQHTWPQALTAASIDFEQMYHGALELAQYVQHRIRN